MHLRKAFYIDGFQIEKEIYEDVYEDTDEEIYKDTDEEIDTTIIPEL